RAAPRPVRRRSRCLSAAARIPPRRRARTNATAAWEPPSENEKARPRQAGLIVNAPHPTLSLRERGESAAYFDFAFGSTICATGTRKSVAISADSVCAFLPSRVQPGRTFTTLPPLSIRMLVGIALASKVFQSSPLGSAAHRNLTFFLVV